jgi:hypothetical protein
MSRHLRAHAKIKLHACNICNKAFRDISGLATHGLIHTNSKPIACKSCDKRFRYSRCLTAHIMSWHTDKMSDEYKSWREKLNKSSREKYACNPQYKAAKLMRSAFKNFKNSGPKSGRTMAVVGCSWAELVAHLNDNPNGLVFGSAGVDVDHIRPMKSFTDHTCPVQQRECMNWNNLQLLTEDENRNVKRAEYDSEAYAKTAAGIAIAILRKQWVVEFGPKSENVAVVDESDSDTESCDDEVDESDSDTEGCDDEVDEGDSDTESCYEEI